MIDRWHRPLIALAIAMALLAIVAGILAIADPREILGQNAWFKPLKFAVSISVYAVTVAWLLGQVSRRRRLADMLGTVVTIGLAIEIVVIVGAVVFNTTSHFNVATPLNTSLWSVMALSITVVWIASLVIGVLVALHPGPDAARNLAVRAGVLIGLIGMGLAFLMTGPSADQINDMQGIAGAHAVGVADGGPGIPFLGWSTEGGDLRAPHFFGMHALQVIPLALVALELLARRVTVLRDVRVRFRLILVIAVTFAIVLAALTLQALAGESVVAPSPFLLAVAALTFLADAIAVVLIVGAGRRARMTPPTTIRPPQPDGSRERNDAVATGEEAGHGRTRP